MPLEENRKHPEFLRFRGTQCRECDKERLRSPRWPLWIAGIASILTVTNAALLVGLLSATPSESCSGSSIQATAHPGLNAALRQAASYSPLYDIVDLQPSTEKINGTLFPPKQPSLMRQLPNPLADELMGAWDTARIVPVTREQLVEMGVEDLDTVAKLENEIWGLGDNAYGASMDVFHQLHCLNSMRKLIYPAYYPSNWSQAQSWQPESPLTMDLIHLQHCIDIVAQAIQCTGNLGLVPWRWVETQAYPFPDFSIQRKCASFEAIERWSKDAANVIDTDKWVRVMQKPKDVKQRPAPDAFYIYKAPDKKNPNHVNGANPDEDFNI